MSNHPYPKHVVEAVAEAMGRSRTGEEWSRFQDYFIEHTHVALSALWEASRIDWVDEVTDIPDDAVIRHSDGMTELGEYFKLERTFADHPAHVIHWGDSDA